MAGIDVRWTDVRGRIPQPHRAEDAAVGSRRAELRLWIVPEQDRPYIVEARLLDDGVEVETWTHEYSRRALPQAHHNYADLRERAGLWLLGRPVEEVRPQKRRQ